jgi:aromatic ring hydroxylase
MSTTQSHVAGKKIHTTVTDTEKMPTAASTMSTSSRPMTGEEYIESIRDGREVYLYGGRVKDVTTHPAFRNVVRMTARLYAALHDPKTRDVLTCPTDTGSGGYTMRFFRSARSAEDLVGDRDAIAAWARLRECA